MIAQGPRRQARHPARRLRHRPVPERARAGRDRRRGRDPGGEGHAGRAATSSWSAGSATSRRSGSRWRWRPSARHVTRAGIALTGVGGSTIGATAAADGADRAAADRRQHRRRPPTSRREAARPRTDHRGSAEYKRHMVRTFVSAHPGPRAQHRTDGKGGLTMTIVYEDLGDEAERMRSRSAGSGSRSTARRRSPRWSRGCCWPT